MEGRIFKYNVQGFKSIEFRAYWKSKVWSAEQRLAFYSTKKYKGSRYFTHNYPSHMPGHLYVEVVNLKAAKKAGFIEVKK